MNFANIEKTNGHLISIIKRMSTCKCSLWITINFNDMWISSFLRLNAHSRLLVELIFMSSARIYHEHGIIHILKQQKILNQYNSRCFSILFRIKWHNCETTSTCQLMYTSHIIALCTHLKQHNKNFLAYHRPLKHYGKKSLVLTFGFEQ